MLKKLFMSIYKCSLCGDDGYVVISCSHCRGRGCDYCDHTGEVTIPCPRCSGNE